MPYDPYKRLRDSDMRYNVLMERTFRRSDREFEKTLREVEKSLPPEQPQPNANSYSRSMNRIVEEIRVHSRTCDLEIRRAELEKNEAAFCFWHGKKSALDHVEKMRQNPDIGRFKRGLVENEKHTRSEMNKATSNQNFKDYHFQRGANEVFKHLDDLFELYKSG